jgi:hypothetical protein
VSSRTQGSPSSSSSRSIAARAAWIRAFASSLASTPPSSRSTARISGVSVRPCRTSVEKITPKVMKMIRFRAGNGPPPSTWSGIASAAASDTAPRIPDQAITAFACHEGAGSSIRNHRLMRASA